MRIVYKISVSIMLQFLSFEQGAVFLVPGVFHFFKNVVPNLFTLKLPKGYAHLVFDSFLEILV